MFFRDLFSRYFQALGAKPWAYLVMLGLRGWTSGIS